jgi:hypothetical protein
MHVAHLPFLNGFATKRSQPQAAHGPGMIRDYALYVDVSSTKRVACVWWGCVFWLGPKRSDKRCARDECTSCFTHKMVSLPAAIMAVHVVDPRCLRGVRGSLGGCVASVQSP